MPRKKVRRRAPVRRAAKRRKRLGRTPALRARKPKKRAAPRRVSQQRARRGRKAAPKKRRRARPPIGRRIREVERGIDSLGREHVKRGSIILGQTRWLTPTRQGFAAVSRVLHAIIEETDMRDPQTFTYDLEITFRGPNGNPEHVTRSGVGIPRLRDLKQLAGEDLAAALERIVEQRIRLEIHGVLRARLGGYSLAGKTKGKKLTKKQAIEELRRLKRTRDVRFRLTFKREVVEAKARKTARKKKRPATRKKPARKKKRPARAVRLRHRR